MQIPKSLLIICMAALGVSSIHAQRPDSDLQTKAREQLRQKMAELQNQPPANADAAPASPKPPRKVEAPAVQPVAAAPAQPPVSEAPKAAPAAATPATPPVIYNRLDSSVEAKAREALRQKIAESGAEEKHMMPAEKQPAKTEMAKEPAKVEKPDQVNAAKTKAEQAELRAAARAAHEKDIAEAKAEAQTRAAAAKQQKIDAANEAKRMKVEAKAAAQAEKTKPQQVVFSPVAESKEKPVHSANTVTVAPAATTPAPAPNSKAARLADLLQQYKTDKITPTTYHAERAKIMAEP